MPIGTPVSIGFNTSSGSTYTTADLSITAGSAIPAGSLVVVMTGAGNDFSGSADPVNKVWDGTNNYTKITTTQVGVNQIWNMHYFYYANSVTPTITTVWAQNSRIQFIQAAYVSGITPTSPQDKSATTSGTGTSISLATGALSQASEIVFSGAYIAGGTSYSPGTGFTNALNNLNSFSQRFVLDYQIVNSTSTVTWAPSWTTSNDYSAITATFKAPLVSAYGFNAAMMGM